MNVQAIAIIGKDRALHDKEKALSEKEKLLIQA
jgi:hypothetical protein